jgi:hypothetical protein
MNNCMRVPVCLSYKFSKYLTNVHKTCYFIKTPKAFFQFTASVQTTGERANFWEGSDMMTISFEV